MTSVIRGEAETTGDDDILVVIDGNGGLPGCLHIGFGVQSSRGVGAVVASRLSAIVRDISLD